MHKDRLKTLTRLAAIRRIQSQLEAGRLKSTQSRLKEAEKDYATSIDVLDQSGMLSTGLVYVVMRRMNRSSAKITAAQMAVKEQRKRTDTARLREKILADRLSKAVIENHRLQENKQAQSVLESYLQASGKLTGID